MTAPTLPRAVSTGTDIPIYFMRSTADDLTVQRFVPFLPGTSAETGFRWAEPSEVASPHLALDVTAVAELLFAAGIDPDVLSDVDAVAVVDEALSRCHCDLSVCAAVLAQEYGEHPEVASWRMTACVRRAGQLLGTEV